MKYKIERISIIFTVIIMSYCGWFAPLPESELGTKARYEIWIKICEIDEKAVNEAKERYIKWERTVFKDEDRMKIHREYWELMEKYKTELAKELKIGLEILNDIQREGLRKDWPIRNNS